MTTSHSYSRSSSMKNPDQWDSSLYEDRHSFVWKAGAGLLDLLAPQTGERILDLGCGTGQLTDKIAAAGATVLGMDSSLSMVAQARRNYPKLKFALDDARKFTLDQPVDAVFSNACLHWIPEAEAVIERVAAALKPGGRFVLEMGGRHNIALIRTALEAQLLQRGYPAESPWYYPSVGQYATLLERHGFELRYASAFPRFTQLEHPERGLREWLEMFAQPYLKAVPAAIQTQIYEAMEAQLRPELFQNGNWHADYRRLRISAVKDPSPES